MGAFKTVGYSRVGKPGAPNPYGLVHKNYTWATVSARDDIAVYAEAFGIPESHVVATGVPRVDPMFDPEHRAASLAAVAAAFPETVGRTVILFAPTFRGHGAKSASYDNARIDVEALHALCVERDAVCLVRMHPFVREPLAVPEALRDRIVDASATATGNAATPDRDQRPAVRGRPPDHRLFVDRVRVLDPRPADAVLRLRPRRLRREPRLLRAVRVVRPRPHRAHVPGAARRHPPRGLRAGEGRAVRAPPLRPPRRRVDRSGHRPDHAAVRSAIVRLRAWAVRAGFLVGSIRPPRRRVVLATSHQGSLSGNLAYLAEELAARRPAVPVTVLVFRPERGVVGRLKAIAFAARAGYHLAAARAFVVDDYFFPMYVIRPRPGTLRLQVWHAAGAFKKFGYSVLGLSFGADEAFVRRVAIHGNYSLALVSSMAVAPHYAEAFGQPVDLFTSRLGLPRTDLFADPARRDRALERLRATLRPARTAGGSSSTRRRSAATRWARPATTTCSTCASCTTSWATTTRSCSSCTRSCARGSRSRRTSRRSPSTPPPTPTSTS